MINIMHSSDMPMNQVEKCLDPQLWHACAGGMAQIPPINSKVYYFPQGHAEHANKNVDFGGFSRIPPLIPCSVSSIKYLADSDTDEVFAKIKLVPLRGNECDIDDEGGLMGGFDKNEEKEKPNSFAKTLTQSDANNGGGFSVPRYCAETIFPRLDYTAEPPVQTILAKDVHNEVWKFRHIYRGTPRRHLLTTGWSNFVNRKKLVAGDSIVFLRAENGDLCIGIRRAKMGIGGGPEVGWNAGGTNCGPSLYRAGFENGNFCAGSVKKVNGGDLSNVGAESVVEAANLAVGGREFEVVYYPRASTPEFVVRASAVRAAMRVQWCVGMRFKMAFETEDSSRISWFMGTIASVQVDDPIRWPNSPWRLLQVAWDEPDLLQNVKRVSPWLVELVSNIPPIHHHHPHHHHLSPFSPPRKRARVPQHSEFQHFPISPISPFCCLPDSISAGIQGARHALLSSSDLLQFNNLQTTGLQPPHYGPGALPKMDIPTGNLKKNPIFRLFGQSILTEQQMSQQSVSVDNNSLSQENVGNVSNGSGSAVIQNSPPGDEGFSWFKDQKLETGFETGHCKVFVESEDVGRSLDLTILNSFEELYGKLAAMFGISRSEMLSNLVYSDAEGITKHAGDEPFGVFVKKARRLTVLTDSSSDNRGN